MTDGFLVLGGSGFVGRELMSYFDCPGTSTTGDGGFIRCDATDVANLKTVIEKQRPGTVINCVGLADVDRAESEPELATQLNEITVKNIVSLTRSFRFRLVHISTDYVFDGSAGNYTEEDSACPINVYGRTKLAGERAALSDSGALIARISTPFGDGRGSGKKQFFRFVLDTLSEGKEVRAVGDQFVTSTYLPDLANALERLCRQDCSGIYHITCQNRMSRYEFARSIAETAGLDNTLVTEASMNDMRWKAARPRDTSLSVQKSLSRGVKFRATVDALRELISNGQGRSVADNAA